MASYTHYKHQVFFKAAELTAKEKGKIHNYFAIKRKSGGGECGPVEKVSDGTYKISFLELEAQQRVLHKGTHVVDSTPVKLCISLTGNDTSDGEQDTSDGEQDTSDGEQDSSEKQEFNQDISIMASSKVPQRLTLESLTEEAENSWSAELTWSFPHAMNDTSRSFLILYHCEGLEPQTITSDECTTVIKDLRPDTKYTADVCTVFQDDKKSANTSITFYTRELRIVLLGKTGTGKSSTGNTILGEEAFGIGNSVASETAICTAKSKIVRGRKIKIVDTPGMFDTDTPEEYLIPEITACITECSPGPHAFIILLKAEKYTQQEKDVLEKLKNLFEGDALKHAVLLFTQGDQLGEAQTIQDFLKGKENLDQGQRGKDVSHRGSPKCHLKDLVDACGGRCHVIDNRYWNQEHEYRSNSIQVERLLNTIEEIVACTIDSGGYYTNDFLKYVEENIKEEMLKIWSKEKTLCRTKVRQQARKTVEKQILSNRVAGLTSGILIGALCGPFTVMGVLVGLVLELFKRIF